MRKFILGVLVVLVSFAAAGQVTPLSAARQAIRAAVATQGSWLGKLKMAVVIEEWSRQYRVGIQQRYLAEQSIAADGALVPAVKQYLRAKADAVVAEADAEGEVVVEGEVVP